MNLTVAYDLLYHNWYVGEFYQKFTEKLKQIDGITVNKVSLREMCGQYGLKHDYNNGFPSIFSPYNLIIINEDNGKTFIHSWHDYAPAMMENGSGIEKFDVVKFSCVSRLDQRTIDKYKEKYNVQPSFYILESWKDHNLIDENKNIEKTKNKIYFNGLCHGIREKFRQVLTQSAFFDFKNKNSDDYRTKEEYYKELSDYKYGLNLDGAAGICYRDLEYFGMGTLLLRDELNIVCSDPIIEGVHYIKIIDQEIKNLINNNDNHPLVLSKIEKNVLNALMSYDINQIIKNAKEWFDRNCLPENQIELMLSYLEDFKIFEGDSKGKEQEILTEEVNNVEINVNTESNTELEIISNIENKLFLILEEINKLKSKF
jgi:hypothetical protein